jgi:hypothetical protein
MLSSKKMRMLGFFVEPSFVSHRKKYLCYLTLQSIELCKKFNVFITYHRCLLLLRVPPLRRTCCVSIRLDS